MPGNDHGQRTAPRAAILVVKALVAAALTWAFVLPILLALPLPAAIVLAAAVWLGATLTPWGRFWRSEWSRGQALRQTRRSRFVLAGGLGLAGTVVCVASDYWFGTHTPGDLGREVIGARWDLLISAPFWLVGLLLLMTGMSRAAALIAGVLLGVLSAFSYDAVDTSHSSTAAIGLLYPWLLGLPSVGLIYAVDAGVRAASPWHKFHKFRRT